MSIYSIPGSGNAEEYAYSSAGVAEISRADLSPRSLLHSRNRDAASIKEFGHRVVTWISGGFARVSSSFASFRTRVSSENFAPNKFMSIATGMPHLYRTALADCYSKLEKSYRAGVINASAAKSAKDGIIEYVKKVEGLSGHREVNDRAISICREMLGILTSRYTRSDILNETSR